MGRYLPDLQFQPYVSSYVGNANKELAETRDILKDTYTKNLAEADAVDLAFRQLPVLKGDTLHKEKAGEAIKSVFNQIAESGGDYENQTNRVRTLVKDIKGNPILLAAAKNYKAVQDEIALEQQMRANGQTPLNFNKDRDNFSTVGPNGEIQEYKSGLEKGLNWRADAKEYIGKIESVIKELNPEIDEKLSKSISYDMLKTGRVEMITDPMTRKRVEQVLDEFMQSNTGGNQFVRWTKFNNPEADERKAAFDLLHGVAQEQIFTKPTTELKALRERVDKSANGGAGGMTNYGSIGRIITDNVKLDDAGGVKPGAGIDPLTNAINESNNINNPNRSIFAFHYKSALASVMTNPNKTIASQARAYYNLEREKETLTQENRQKLASAKNVYEIVRKSFDTWNNKNALSDANIKKVEEQTVKNLSRYGLSNEETKKLARIITQEELLKAKTTSVWKDTDFENAMEKELEETVNTIGIPMAQPNYMVLKADDAAQYKRAAETNLSSFDLIGNIDDSDLDKPATITKIGLDVVGGGKGIPFLLTYKTKGGEEKTILGTPKETGYGNQLLSQFRGLMGEDLPNKDTYKNVPVLKVGKQYGIQELMEMNGRGLEKTKDKIVKVKDDAYIISKENGKPYTIGESFSSIDLSKPEVADFLTKQAILNGLATADEIAPNNTPNIFLLTKILPQLKTKTAYYDTKYDILNQYK